jgi:hypothetical protein
MADLVVLLFPAVADLMAPPTSAVWRLLLVAAVVACLVGAGMLLRGFDRRKTLRAMPVDTVLVEIDRRGRRVLIARGQVRPEHIVWTDREVLPE